MSWYLYVGNNPLTYTDPAGLRREGVGGGGDRGVRGGDRGRRDRGDRGSRGGDMMRLISGKEILVSISPSITDHSKVTTSLIYEDSPYPRWNIYKNIIYNELFLQFSK
jgi:hypothetical protein